MSYSVLDEMIGQVMVKIDQNRNDDHDEILFYFSNGAIYRQYHDQDCCEYVSIEDIDGDLNDLIGFPLLQAEESTSDATSATNAESATWTFYKFATIKGYVTIRWYGSSNGYYSECADIVKLEDGIPIKDMRKLKLNKILKNK